MKKPITIFYSWQSDIPSKFNKTFIEKALAKALTRLRSDATLEPALRDTEITLDMDTQGVAGSPPIAQTILKKIEECAVFIADLIFVGESTQDGKNGKKRLFPNGHERLVAIVNTAFGESHADNLPFDLRHLRWPICYKFNVAENEQKEMDGAKALRLKRLEKENARPPRVKENAQTKASKEEGARVRRLLKENARLKRLVADQALDIQILKEVNLKTGRLFDESPWGLVPLTAVTAGPRNPPVCPVRE